MGDGYAHRRDGIRWCPLARWEVEAPTGGMEMAMPTSGIGDGDIHRWEWRRWGAHRHQWLEAVTFTAGAHRWNRRRRHPPAGMKEMTPCLYPIDLSLEGVTQRELQTRGWWGRPVMQLHRRLVPLVRQDMCLRGNSTPRGDQLMCLYSKTTWFLAEQGYNLNRYREITTNNYMLNINIEYTLTCPLSLCVGSANA
jgi:hypothetical protein